MMGNPPSPQTGFALKQLRPHEKAQQLQRHQQQQQQQMPHFSGGNKSEPQNYGIPNPLGYVQTAWGYFPLNYYFPTGNPQTHNADPHSMMKNQPMKSATFKDRPPGLAFQQTGTCPQCNLEPMRDFYMPPPGYPANRTYMVSPPSLCKRHADMWRRQMEMLYERNKRADPFPNEKAKNDFIWKILLTLLVIFLIALFVDILIVYSPPLNYEINPEGILTRNDKDLKYTSKVIVLLLCLCAYLLCVFIVCCWVHFPVKYFAVRLIMLVVLTICLAFSSAYAASAYRMFLLFMVLCTLVILVLLGLSFTRLRLTNYSPLYGLVIVAAIVVITLGIVTLFLYWIPILPLLLIFAVTMLFALFLVTDVYVLVNTNWHGIGDRFVLGVICIFVDIILVCALPPQVYRAYTKKQTATPVELVRDFRQSEIR